MEPIARANRFGVRVRCRMFAILFAGSAGVAMYAVLSADEPAIQPRQVDPAAWGNDHVGKQFPEYMTGDECLFCHRAIGATWSGDRHQSTIRLAPRDDPAIKKLREAPDGREAAAETGLLLGSRRMTRFLRRATEYGKLELLTTSFDPQKHVLISLSELSEASKTSGDQGAMPHRWDARTFGDRCAGCHTTAVDVQSRAFSALSIDCFACHGNVDLAHTRDTSLVLLSSKKSEPRPITSICGQCHLRGGASKSTKLPYPNTFVPGDNLFRDFQVDLSDGAIRDLPAMEQHIYLNARDVAVFDRLGLTCVTCHDIHGAGAKKHQQLADSAICLSCHVSKADSRELRDALLPGARQRQHSRVCDY